MKMLLRLFFTVVLVMGLPFVLWGQAGGTVARTGYRGDTVARTVERADTIETENLSNVTVTARRSGLSRVAGVENGVRINREELFKAACCNLGESFTTNPSVDVNYSDAATGAKQIKLLGLSGIYVQMLTENLPNFRGGAAPFALDFVPGPWMNSIQVSKGASSVRNGYESITGQINVEYLKPDEDEGVTFNLYGNSMSRFEANADANIHLSDALSSELLAHYQDDFSHHDKNKDGFLDQPNVRQWNLQNRWKRKGEKYLFHGGIGLIKEKRDGGQTHHTAPEVHNLYKIGIETNRYEGYMKHAYILDSEHGTNIALMGVVSMDKLDALYGRKSYNLNEKNAYAQLLFETNFTEHHNLSAGLSLNYDYFGQGLKGTDFQLKKESETTPGAYVQYTFKLGDKLIAMAGIRGDHSSVYGSFLTPRFHLKFSPTERISVRLSAGKGYRTPHAVAENNTLLSSGRSFVVDNLDQECAWNYGVSCSFNIPLFHKTLKLNAEYYYTHFKRQVVIDYDTDPSVIHIGNLNGKSYSNTFQADASYPIISGLELLVAYRLNSVKISYGGVLLNKPLLSCYKGLVNLSYKTPLGLWQVDATLQLNGGGRLPSGLGNFHSYEQLSLQVTRWFRHFSIYVGGENLTGFRQKQTIINPSDPWSSSFDPTLVWGPVHGALFYVGVRINFGKL